MKNTIKRNETAIFSLPAIIISTVSLLGLVGSTIFCFLTSWSNWWLLLVFSIGLFLFLWLLLYIFVFSIALCYSKKKKYTKLNKFAYWILNLGYGILIGCSRTTIHVTGLNYIPQDSKFLLVSNHRSKFDNMIQSYVLRKYPIAYVSKPSNFNIPFVGNLMHRNLYLSLNRESLRDSVKTIVHAKDMIDNDIVNIGIFPEGTRSVDLKLGVFKPGSFKIATNSSKPILVVSMQGTEKIHKNFPFKRTKVEMNILGLISGDDLLKPTVDIADIVEKMIDESIK